MLTKNAFVALATRFFFNTLIRMQVNYSSQPFVKPQGGNQHVNLDKNKKKKKSYY